MQPVKFRTLVFIFCLLVLAVGATFFALKERPSKETPLSDLYDTNAAQPQAQAIVVPCIASDGVSCSEPPTTMSIVNSSDWTRNFYVISNSLTSKKANGEDGQVFSYGDSVVLNGDREVLIGEGDKVKASGFFLKSDRGLLIDSLSPAYKKVFTVDVDSYKNIPIEVKYKIIERSNTPCGISGISSVDAIASFLFGTIPSNIWASYDKWNGLNSCTPSYALPRSSFIAENAVAYADLDNNRKTKDHVLVVMESTQYGTGGNCAGVPVIFSVDANGEYYTKDVSAYNVCYVKTLKKGTGVEITKITQSNNGGQQEVKEAVTLTSDSFALYFDNQEVTYLVYDQTTSTQVKLMPSKEYTYSPENP